MDPQKQREIASKGGKAAHQKGTAHEFTSEEARVAGRKGGAASRAKRTGEQFQGITENSHGQSPEPRSEEMSSGESEAPV
jgi:general stress protein YciG